MLIESNDFALARQHIIPTTFPEQQVWPQRKASGGGGGGRSRGRARRDGRGVAQGRDAAARGNYADADHDNSDGNIPKSEGDGAGGADAMGGAGHEAKADLSEGECDDLASLAGSELEALLPDELEARGAPSPPLPHPC